MLLPHIKRFQETKNDLELVSLPHFLHDFWRKEFLTGYSISCPNFIIWLTLLLEILSNMCIVIICFPVFNKAKKNNNFLKGESKSLRPIKSNFTIIWINIMEFIDVCRVIVNFMNSQYSRSLEHFTPRFLPCWFRILYKLFKYLILQVVDVPAFLQIPWHPQVFIYSYNPLHWKCCWKILKYLL